MPRWNTKYCIFHIEQIYTHQLLNLLVSWLSGCYSYVQSVDFGVRQVSVLSPYLFAMYMDDLAQLGQFNRGMFIILYADDILLIALSIRQLQDLLLLCESV